VKLYMTERSGNAYKARLLLAMLGVAYEPVMVDLAAGENHTPAFLALNPRGQVPVIEDEGKMYWDSTAVLVYLARKHDPYDRWLPNDAHGMAEVMQWLALAQNEIRYGLQSAYVMIAYNRSGHLEECRELGRKALHVLNARLSQRDWLALDRVTIADLACYPYAASAPVAGVALEPYEHVERWIARIESLPGWFSRLARHESAVKGA
jgi:glutathione S-transferase